MQWFEHRDDVEEWLRPLDCDTFWREIELYGVSLTQRSACDAQIASGAIDEPTVLTALKALTVMEMVEGLD